MSRLPGQTTVPYRADAAEERVVGAQAIEHGTPEQVLDVPLHNGTVCQGQAEPSTFERLGRLNTKQHHTGC